MRDLILARIKEVIIESGESDPLEEMDMTIEEIPTLSDQKLLDVYDYLTGFNG